MVPPHVLDALRRPQLHHVERIPAAPSAHSAGQLRSARRDMALSCAAVAQHLHEVRRSLRRVSPASTRCRTGHCRSPRTTHGRSSCTRCSDSHWWWLKVPTAACFLSAPTESSAAEWMAANSSASNAASRASASSASRNSVRWIRFNGGLGLVFAEQPVEAGEQSVVFDGPGHRDEAGVSKYIAIIWGCRTLRSLGWRSL